MGIWSFLKSIFSESSTSDAAGNNDEPVLPRFERLSDKQWLDRVGHIEAAVGHYKHIDFDGIAEEVADKHLLSEKKK